MGIAVYEAYLNFLDRMAWLARWSLLTIPAALAYGYLRGSPVPDFWSQCGSLLSDVSPWVREHKMLVAVWIVIPCLLVRPLMVFPSIYAAAVAAANLGAGHWGIALGGFALATVVFIATGATIGWVHWRLIDPSLRAIEEGLWRLERWAAGAVKPGDTKEIGTRALGPELAGDERVAEPALKFPIARPRFSFSDLAGMASAKCRLLDAGHSALSSGLQATNGILLYSRPGNGKTAISEALAGELGVGFISVSIADIGSKWVGQTTEQLVQAFRDAERQAPCVLLIDEVDSVISDRSDGSSHDGQRTTNAFLTEMVRIRGRGVVVIAATNFLDRLDVAAIREGRFDFKIELPPPDLPARIGLLTNGLKREAPFSSVLPTEIRAAAERWVGFSAARLLAIAHQAGKVLPPTGGVIDRHDLARALREVQAKRSTFPESTKCLDDLALEPGHSDTLFGLAWRMKEIFDAEAVGATVPDGILFYGPPGTGKTEAARALAKETGWAFFITNGSELAYAPSKIGEICAQAEDARPAIIFIDEADDILADRKMGGARVATNTLLTVMDGAHGKAPDVLYIAATNHPEMLDPAVLRGGRFTEKVGFLPPQGEALRAFVHGWLADKGWEVEGGLDQAVLSVQGLAVANVKAVLQAALNYTVNRSVRAHLPVVKMLDAEALANGFATVAPVTDPN
ncbi:AAA family ATPase [Paucibacter sp. DJ1R-11]|uniref:AAA family ATPase n=1 Tax=Paucibacter sp. DJ1R-11 TaxID=2893556 RepID=UPI0021E3CC41|nr:AAA family ATPase [Paucibacter sp. DJ1R-11]MCV2363854.1 AAA family ATPase [Paucibacter sp. DJ1R-11]